MPDKDVSPNLVAEVFKVAHNPLHNVKKVSNGVMRAEFGQPQGSQAYYMVRICGKLRSAYLFWYLDRVCLLAKTAYMSKEAFVPIYYAQHGQKMDWASFIFDKLQLSKPRDKRRSPSITKVASYLQDIFSHVLQGALSSGERVAIKKLTIGGQHAKQEFLNEVNLITSVQHRNLIKLLGCCVEGIERILVYEYLPNKSLDLLVCRILNWPTRYSIILGMTKDLAYLHEESHMRTIHRDMKPSNVLLDDELNPVIADFGLARLLKDNATHVNIGVVGTM
ncbi:hypothetical protein L7F22_028538 [Adiantum nelumboides]|nr:hypothetical protein [Adiantum nelumboides]